MATILVRNLSDETKERLRRRAFRQRRSLAAEVRAIVDRAAQEGTEEAEPFPDWFIRMTRPGIDLDEAIEENRRTRASSGDPGRRGQH